MNYKYKFAVIVPVYNVEKYLAESLDSIVNQTIGFEDNIQLILVNDGSTDNSGAVCARYKDKYPDNVVYIEKENAGVSAARNEALKHIDSKYTAFLDSDDKWALSAFEKAYDFIEKHYDEIDLVCCRVKRFEAQTNYHVLDYKFKAGTRIADINDPEEYFSIQTLITSVIAKSDAIKDLEFDTRLICSEDTFFSTKIILKKCKIGLLKEALYYYRQRSAKNSTMDRIRTNKFYYDEMLDYFHLSLIEYSRQQFGKVLPFVQATVTNDLMWRFEACETHKVLNDDEFTVYSKTLKVILEQLDDDIVFNHPMHKAYARRSAAAYFKYGVDYFKALELKDNSLYYRKYNVFDMSQHNTLCVLNSIAASGNTFRVEVLIANWLLRSTASGGRLVLKVGERFVKPKEILEYAPKTARDINGGEYYYSSCVFRLKLKLKEGETAELTPHLIYGDRTAPICLNCTRSAMGINPHTTCLLQGAYTVTYEDDKVQIRR